MLVVASVVMAALIVALAIILSAGIHAGVMASTESAPEAGDAAQAYADTRRAVVDTRQYVNANRAASHGTLAANLSASLTATGDALGDEYAANGAAFDLSAPTTTNRTVVEHTDATRRFTDATGATEWTLADTVTGTDTFHVDATRDGLADPGTADRFRVRVTNGTATWSVALANDTATGAIVADITTPGGSSTCSVAADTARLDLTDGTLSGSSCPDLAFDQYVTGPYRVSYANADNATGEYTVDLTTSGGVDPTSYGPASASPTATYSVATVTVRYSYRTAGVHHAANVTAP